MNDDPQCLACDFPFWPSAPVGLAAERLAKVSP